MDEALIKAAELIENNFARNEYADARGRLCMDGALLRALGVEVNFSDYDTNLVPKKPYNAAIQKVSEVLPLVDDCEVCDRIKQFKAMNNAEVSASRVHHYNDEHCHGGVEAAKILREAAEVEERNA